jgi:outer membrane lipoprotein SlyB
VRKLIILFTAAAFVAASAGCATVDYPGRILSGKEKRKIENENRYNFVKGLCTFGGFAIGGLTGGLTANGNDRIPSMLKGCLIGTIAGFAAGYVVSENMKDTDDDPNPKPDKSRIEEYFKDSNGN